MAPSRTRKQASRQADYSNIGVAGRKTGITLKDSGVRDEHGLEPIEGIFSSPEKPVSSQNNNSNHTIVDEEDMSIETSTVPEPLDILSSRRVTMPPRSRSPIKTRIGSSPRKSLGHQSSPMRSVRKSSSPGGQSARGLSRPQEARNSPLMAMSRNRAIINHPKTPSSSSRKRKRVFDINTAESEDETADDPVPVPEEASDAAIDIAAEADEPSILPQDDTVAVNAEDENNGDQDILIDNTVVDHEVSSAAVTGKKRGRPKTKGIDVAGGTEDAPVSKAQTGKPSTARRGRPPKNAQAHDREINSGDTEKTHKDSKTGQDIGRAKGKPSKADRPPPAKRNPNARIVGSASQNSPRETLDHAGATDIGRPKPRSLLMLRSETPAEDNGALIMRSGRTSVKPLAFWRNERIVYDKHNIDGVRLPLLGMKEVIRTEEAPLPERKAPRRGRKPRKLQHMSEEDDDEQEEWEKETGILEAPIMDWDPEAQKGLEDNPIDIELAFAPKGLDEATRDVKNSSFQYGKTVTLPFFHSGVVDLPPGGEKKMKNSRRNHMVFWVFSGRVDVDVSSNQFSIGRGGMWQVPRGNFYNLTNPYEKPARVFFAQGCYMTEKEGLEMSE